MLLKLSLFLALASPVPALRTRRPGHRADESGVSLQDTRRGCGSVSLPPWSKIAKYVISAQVYRMHNSSNSTAIVTYAGLQKQSYIDGAVLLARSLVHLNLSTELWCLVHKSMANSTKRILQHAGWNIREVESWLPEHWIKRDCGYWHDAYNKVDIFRLPFKKVLYLDADTLVMGSSNDLNEILEPELQPGEIKMVKDCNGKNFNSGVMVFQPTLDAFRRVHEIMAEGQLDQPAINVAYAGNITRLPNKYNVHGYGKHNCNDTVIAHYTGQHKPAEASLTNMRRVSNGAYAHISQYALNCPDLYERYFAELEAEVDYLSPKLQELLTLPSVMRWMAGGMPKTTELQ
mmetsp:Transcript_83056/g.192944  ORF Transcript_83056/g.192944 Transcript_83056/m.192944 type:complete len:346 (+) Transcript_83056:50-1087(+)|eukprot:CAMPEP_0171098096 /NCGR_PEP_ID=MMETSP0766_2-20121228/47926_1 /TAXON_ID=439317 /ORGANISM="Gambierdiscus australes, Strain CAWD 149" /LENGTH=345 /DNA_ID=CAMNT_0011557397 /DNA_START=36 /DNA_END=1073 /DNA_ORIENTATION=+